MFGPEVVEVVEKKLKEIGMTKGKFYEQSGISSATFSQWRQGMYDPSGDALSKLESLLGISFSLKDKNSPEDKSPRLSDDEMLLINLYRSLPEEERRFFLRQAKALAARQ